MNMLVRIINSDFGVPKLILVYQIKMLNALMFSSYKII